jgi:hypothetical protein
MLHRLGRSALALAILAGPGLASASTLTQLGTVDFIDAVFASGGGSYTKSLTGGPDDGWSVFAANSGDSLSVTLSASTGTSGAAAAYDGAVLLEVSDGVVAVGDAANISDFSINQLGSGTDLVVQHMGFNPGPGGSYQFTSSMSQTISFTAATTGQYAIGVSCSDETCVNGSTFTVQLSGNTATVPEPGALVLVATSALGLLAHSGNRWLRGPNPRVGTGFPADPRLERP